MYFVCLIINEAPTKFSHEPCKDDELIDMIGFFYLCSAGQNVAAWLLFSGLRLLKIFLGANALWQSVTGGSAGGKFHQASCAASFRSAAAWRGRHNDAIEEISVFCSGLGSLNVGFSPVYVCGFAAEFPDSPHMWVDGVCDLRLRPHSMAL